MALKTAVFLALVGTCLATIVQVMDFITIVSAVVNDVMPAVALLRSLVYSIASLALTVFFFVFYRTQR